MSKAKFTKGPWIVSGASMAMGSEYRGTFSVESSNFSGDAQEASIANAHLIAAAPDMYQLLSRLSDLSPPIKHCSEDEWAALLEIDGALAKARGEQLNEGNYNEKY